LRDIELGGERNRGLYVLKSRGMAHSNQIREFLLTSQGIQLMDVYVGAEGVLTGSMRLAQEQREREAEEARKREAETKLRGVERKRKELEARIAALQVELDEANETASRLGASEGERERRMADDRKAMGRSRKSDSPGREVQGNATKPGVRN
jgi:circadian clock protein KaiC